MLSLWPLLLSLVCMVIGAHGKSSTGDSVLVVLDPSLKRENFSIFFKQLEGWFASDLLQRT